MKMRFTGIPFIGVIVDEFIPLMDVGMGVAMPMEMGMYQISMPMLVIVHMGMFMGVLQSDGIFHHQNCCNNHDDQTHIELDTGAFVQQQDTEYHTQKGCDGVIGAGLGSTQLLLGFDVKVDAQTVSHEAQQKYSTDPEDTGDLFSNHQCDYETAQTGEGTLDGGDLDGGF